MKREHFKRAKGVVDACPICNSKIMDVDDRTTSAINHHKDLVGKIGGGLQVVEEHLPLGWAQVIFDFKSKESLPKSRIQLGNTYYQHIDIPVLIFVVFFWMDSLLVKRIFIITSSHGKQDTHFVIDSINYVLGVFFFVHLEFVYSM
jgi:hypothetical protein